jgi:hypothetical protein
MSVSIVAIDVAVVGIAAVVQVRYFSRNASFFSTDFFKVNVTFACHYQVFAG